MGVCGIFRPPVQGGSNELISKCLSSMILYNHSSYFKSGEINSCRLSPLPTSSPMSSIYSAVDQQFNPDFGIQNISFTQNGQSATGRWPIPPELGL